MKKLSILVFLAWSMAGYAQTLRVDTKTVKNDEGAEIDAWIAHLDQLPDECMESYDNFMDKTFDLKTSKLSKTAKIVEMTRLQELSSLRIDVRTYFIAESGGTGVAFTFSPGYDIHFNPKSYSEEFRNAERFVKSYVKFHYKNIYNKKISDLQKTIKEKQDLIIEGDKKIEKNKKAILDNTKDIDKGSSDSGKLRLKNDTLEKENLTLTGEVSKNRGEVTVLQEQLKKLNESLKKVEEF